MERDRDTGRESGEPVIATTFYCHLYPGIGKSETKSTDN